MTSCASMSLCLGFSKVSLVPSEHDLELAVALLLNGKDCVQQREDVIPFEVVGDRMLEDLFQRGSVMAGEASWLGLGHSEHPNAAPAHLRSVASGAS